MPPKGVKENVLAGETKLLLKFERSTGRVDPLDGIKVPISRRSNMNKGDPWRQGVVNLGTQNRYFLEAG